MATTPTAAADTVVLLNQTNGITLIPKPTALTRLNYFDGKFLSAADLNAEQAYHRRLQQLAAQAGGSGVVHGFEIRALAGDQIELAAGLAVDAEGRVLFMPQEAAVGVEDLIQRSRFNPVVKAGGGKGSAAFTLCEAAAVTPEAPVVAGTSLYVLGIAHAEALCGQEDSYGKLCVDACAGNTERPQKLEGVVLRALPLQLASALPDAKAETMATLHLRSRVAAAWFEDEARQTGSLISGPGLVSSLWCHGAAPSGGGFVPLAVLARAGGHTVFLDLWTARRERVDGPPRRYWQWRMMMRPWDVFLAQVLQFQCQLRDAWQVPSDTEDDPCLDLKRAVVDVGQVLDRLERQYLATSEKLLRSSGTEKAVIVRDTESTRLSRTLLADAVRAVSRVQGRFTLPPGERVLIRRGIVELPAAGYLPVAPGSAIPVNDQVRRLLGEGVDLRFCVVRPDYVAHALEEAQHMQRISLLHGLDDPQQLEEVDVLVPDGEILAGAGSDSVAWEAHLGMAPQFVVREATALKRVGMTTLPYQRDIMSGASRSEALGDGNLAFFYAGLVETDSRDEPLKRLKDWAGERDNGLEQTLWQSVAFIKEAKGSAPAPAPKARVSRGRAAAASPAAAAAQPAVAELAARYAALRQSSTAYRLKTLERVAGRASSAGIRHYEGLKEVEGADHVALWLALRADTNPFEVAEGGRVGLGMDLTLLAPKGAGTMFVDIGIVGAQFTIASRVVTAQRLALQGTLRGAAIIHGLVGTLANNQRGLQFAVPVLVTAEPHDQGRLVHVEVDFSSLLFDNRGLLGLENVAVSVLTQADGQGIEARVVLRAQGEQTALMAIMQRNPAALQLGNPLRAASETAIDVIATRESTPNFGSQARADLFGERPAQAGALTVRARHDWVLFHRRRHRQCGSAPTRPVLEQRRYELQHLRVKTEAQLRNARAAVIGANAEAIRKLGFAPVGAVAFEAGRSALATATEALLADWDAAQPGRRIRFGAIGSLGAAQAEGDALALARLSALELTLARGQLDAGVENQVLPVLPSLGLAGWDGAIFVVTIDTKPVCHDVYRLRGMEQAKAFAALVRQAGLQAAIRQFELQPLAHVQFQADAQSLDAKSVDLLKRAWGDAGAAEAAALSLHAGTAGAEAAAQAQSAAIVAVLGGAAGDVKPMASNELTGLTDCAAITVVVAPEPVQVVTTRVLVAAAAWDGRFYFTPDLRVTVEPFQDGQPVDAAAFTAGVRVLLRNQPLAVTTAAKTAADLPGAEPVKAAVEAALKNLPGHTVRNSDTAVLGPDEIKDLLERGFPPDGYDLAVVFSPGRT